MAAARAIIVRNANGAQEYVLVNNIVLITVDPSGRCTLYMQAGPSVICADANAANLIGQLGEPWTSAVQV